MIAMRHILILLTLLMLSCTKDDRQEIRVSNGDVYVSELGIDSIARLTFGRYEYVLNIGLTEMVGTYHNKYPYVILDDSIKYILSNHGDILYSIHNKDIVFYKLNND